MQTETAALPTKPPAHRSVQSGDLDVRKIRRLIRDPHFPITQARFAQRFGFSVAAVRDWEQGRRKPDAAARTLLLVIAHNAGAVEAALKALAG